MNLLRIPFIILAVLLLAAPALLAEEIYVWRDEQGTLHMRDKKPPHMEEHESRMQQRQRFMEENPESAEQTRELEEERKAQVPGGGDPAPRQEAVPGQEAAPGEAPMHPALQDQQPGTPPGGMPPADMPAQPGMQEQQQWPPQGLPPEIEEQLRQQFGDQFGQQEFPPLTPGQMLSLMAVPLLIFLVMYLFITYVLYRIGRKFGVGSFWGYLAPIYNIYLLCRCAGLPGWYLLLFFIPFINIFVTFLIWGKIAERLGKNFVLWGVICTVLGLPILVLAFDSSRPYSYQVPPGKAQAPNW